MGGGLQWHSGNVHCICCHNLLRMGCSVLANALQP
jgi:hypothetical protein